MLEIKKKKIGEYLVQILHFLQPSINFFSENKAVGIHSHYENFGNCNSISE